MMKKTIQVLFIMAASAFGTPAYSQIAGLGLGPPPEPADLGKFVVDKDAAIRLGKAFYWEMQAGSDGIQSCSSCHFHAGADHRITNQLTPGLRAMPKDTTFGTLVGPPKPNLGVNTTLAPGDYPFHTRSFPSVQASTVTSDTNDATSSQGVVATMFTDIVIGSGVDIGVPIFPDPEGFNFNSFRARRVEPRNTPTVINVVLTGLSSFSDGRAKPFFNGVNPMGFLDQSAFVLAVVDPDNPASLCVPEMVMLEKSGPASQAVGPPLSGFEMSWEGRTFPKVGKKLLALRPLGRQFVDPTDSVLGPVACTACPAPPAQGLTVSYKTMIETAFARRYWDTGKIVDIDGLPLGLGPPVGTDQFTLMEFNFSLFWGIAIQLYEATLIADRTPFDLDLMTAQQRRGLGRFLSGKARCGSCHSGQEFTNASVGHLLGNEELYEVGILRCGDPGTPAGCGANFAATDPLMAGAVLVLADGSVEVEIEGAPPLTEYTVFVGNWETLGFFFQFQFVGSGPLGSIGSFTTDALGDFSGPVLTPTGATFAFPPGTAIGQLSFAFNNELAAPPGGPLSPTQFTAGFFGAFASPIIPCGAPGTPAGCGANFAATDSLLEGEMEIAGLTPIVGLEGAAPLTPYDVFVGNWDISGVVFSFQFQFVGAGPLGSIGSVTTDAFGNYTGPIITPTATPFFFPVTSLPSGQINFAFNNALAAPPGGPASPTQFTTGVIIPDPALILRMAMGNDAVALYDQGFYNTGRRPTADDKGAGETFADGSPKSWTRLAKLGGPSKFTLTATCEVDLPICPPLSPLEADAVDGAFKTLSVRNQKYTGPHFHEGGESNIRDVVLFYVRGGNFPLNPELDPDIRELGLDAEDIDNVVEFIVNGLNDPRVTSEKAPFDHPELCVPNGHDTVTGVTEFRHVPAVGALGNVGELQTFEEMLNCPPGPPGPPYEPCELARVHTLKDACPAYMLVDGPPAP